MAKFTHRQTDFGSGELGEKLSGRIDLAEYARGLKKMRGFYPVATGGATYCPGARLSTNAVGETLHKYFDPSTGDDLLLTIDGTAGAFDISLNEFTGPAFGTFDIDTTATRTAINLLNIQLDKNQFSFAQIGEILIIVHSSGLLPPIVLSRLSGTVFTLRFYDDSPNRLGLHPSLSYPFESKNITTTTVQSTGTELHASVGIFTVDDVGTWFRIDNDTEEGVFLIDSYTSPTVVGYTGFAISAGYADAASTVWMRQAWSTAKGWPKIVNILDGRTLFHNTNTFMTTTWVSHLNNFFLMTERRYAGVMPDQFFDYFGGLIDTDAFSFPISSGQAREIRWATSQRSLHLGTDEGEYVMVEGGGTFGAELGFSIRQQTSHGSSFVQANKADRASIYISRDGTRIRNFVFSEENGSYFSRDLSILSEDLIKYAYDKSSDRYSDIKIEMTVWDRDRFILWVLTTSGALVGITIVPTSETVGWFARPIGGDGKVLSVAELVDPSSSKTFIYLKVDRGGVITTEKIGPTWESERMPPLPNATLPSIPNSDHIPYYLDKSSRKDPIALEPTNFDMGEFALGETVTALQFKGDNYTVGTYAVVAGVSVARQIVIPDEPDYIVVGYPYEGTIESMNVEAGGVIGNAQPSVKSIEKLFVRVYKSLGGQYGSTESNLKPMVYRDISPLCAYTGDLEVLFPSSPGEKVQYLISQNLPLPLHIVAIFMRGVTQG